MFVDAWGILGIEPTTDKKIIQQAYAEKLKIYHPEEYPEEFQRLQVAYHTASEYARTGNNEIKKEYSDRTIQFQSTKKNETTCRAWEPANAETEPKKQEEAEPVPDYITEIQNTKTENLYEEEYGNYIYILQKILIGQGTDKDLRDIEDLFRDNRFCHVLGAKKFRHRLMEVMDYHEVWNKKALKFLLDKMQELMNDSPNITPDFVVLKRYFEDKQGRRKKPQKEINVNKWILMILFIIIFFIRLRACNNQLEKEYEEAYRSYRAQEEITQYVYEQLQSELLSTEKIGNASYTISTIKTIPELEEINDGRIKISMPEFTYHDSSQRNEEVQSVINKEIQMAALGDHLEILTSEDLSDLGEYEVDYVSETTDEEIFSIQFRGKIYTSQYVHDFSRGITMNALTGEKIPIENYLKIDENLLEEVVEGKKEFESYQGYETEDMFYSLQTFISDYENGFVDSYTCYFLDETGVKLIVPVQGGNTNYFYLVNK